MGASLIPDTDLCKEDKVIWCNSVQSWMVPLCFSMILLECVASENRLESFLNSFIAVYRFKRGSRQCCLDWHQLGYH